MAKRNSNYERDSAALDRIYHLALARLEQCGEVNDEAKSSLVSITLGVYFSGLEGGGESGLSGLVDKVVARFDDLRFR